MNKEKSIEIGEFLGEMAHSLSRVRVEKAFVKDFAGHLSRYTNNLEGVVKYTTIFIEKLCKYEKMNDLIRNKITNITSMIANMEDREYSRTDLSTSFFEKFYAD
ncbi:hypothetical protein AALM74_04790 [Parabacteroides segnis]|uniref:hypothetical protein n=1 Tax=Parabacteroides segnis TaxID=2763058 RepID=UPI003514B6BE